MMNVLDAAFGHPRGPLGRLGGVIMARSTGKRKEWTLSLPDIQRDDRVLEVGCGPGASIPALATKATPADVVGVDLSPALPPQAPKPSAPAIRLGLAPLERAPAPAL